MSVEVCKVLVTYVIRIDGLEHPIHARVLEDQNPAAPCRYRFEISHYCRPGSHKDVHYAFGESSSLEITEGLLKDYLQSFTLDDVTAHPEFWARE